MSAAKDMAVGWTVLTVLTFVLAGTAHAGWSFVGWLLR